MPTGTGGKGNILVKVRNSYYNKYGRKTEEEPPNPPPSYLDKFLTCWERYGPLAEGHLQASCLL